MSFYTDKLFTQDFPLIFPRWRGKLDTQENTDTQPAPCEELFRFLAARELEREQKSDESGGSENWSESKKIDESGGHHPPASSIFC